MKKAFAFLLIFILCLNFVTPLASCAEEYVEAEENNTENNSEEASEEEPKYDANGFPIIASSSAIVMDASTGQVVYEKDGYSKQYPASVTKIMTVLVALEEGNLDDVITLSENAVWGFDRNSSHIALDVGEQIRMEDALYAILMVSANEASIAVAEHIAGSEEAFCQLMNDKAKEIGCTQTNFTNVNGFHDENHYVSAYDMALITKEAMKYETFLDICACTYYEIPPTNYIDEIRYLWQDNKLVEDTSEYYYSYSKGGKYGYTEEAKGSLSVWASYDDMQLICVTMGGNPSSSNYTDSIRLFDYFFYSYYYYSPLEKFEFSAEQLTNVQNYLNAYYKCENAGTLKLSTTKDKKILIFYDTDVDKINFSLNLTSDRIDKSMVGTLDIKDDSKTYLSVPVSFSGYVKSSDPEAIRKAYADGSLREIDYSKADKSIPGLFIVLIILIICFFVIPLELTRQPKQFLLDKIMKFTGNIRSKRH